MPSLSPGNEEPTPFEQILPGAPNAGPYSITTFIFRWKRHIVYISNNQLNIFRSPTEILQAITFDSELVAVRAEAEDSGRLAVASAETIWILRPFTSSWNRVTWVHELKLGVSESKIRTLSWGTEGELLVTGTRQLALYGTLPSSQAASPATSAASIAIIEERNAQWTKPVSCPVRFAAFSPSCSLIATASDNDRLVKVWRRLSFEEAIFDYAYLPHDGIVTHLEWRPNDKEQLESAVTANKFTRFHHGDDHREVLYTISTDGNLRVWQTNSHHDLDMLSLYTTIDLVSAIPHSPVLTTQGSSHRPMRNAFVIPSGAYVSAIAATLKTHPQEKTKYAVEHLKEVASQDPDVVVALDAQGRMSAWGLSAIGHKRRPNSSSGEVKAPFHIAHSENLGLHCDPGVPAAFETWLEGDVLNILAHSFGRSVKWWRGAIQDFSSSSALTFDRGKQIASWTGSTSLITGLRATKDARLVSWASGGDVLEWSSEDHGFEVSMRASSPQPVVNAESVQRHRSFLLLSQQNVLLTRVYNGKGMISRSHALSQSSSLELLQLSDSYSADGEYLIYDRIGRYVSVLVNPTPGEWSSEEQTIETSSVVQELPLGTDIDGGRPNLIHVRAVTHPTRSGWLRMAGIDDKGTLYRRDIVSASLRGKDQTVSEATLMYTTDFKADTVAMTPSCAALLSSTRDELAIFDLEEGYVEHRQKLTRSAQSLAFQFVSTDKEAPTDHSLLAIAYDVSVDILARAHYVHGQGARPPWTIVKRISLGGIGLSISSVAWLSQCRLALAAGSCIFISDDQVAKDALDDSHCQQLELVDDTSMRIDQLVRTMNAALTCWQPRVLFELIFHGYLDAVLAILSKLQTRLRFYTNGDELDRLLDFDIEQLMSGSISEPEEVDFSELGGQLDELSLPFISDEDQERLKLVARTVAYLVRHRQSLDLNAIRYLAYWRYHVLLETRYVEHGGTNGAQRSGNLDHHIDVSPYKATPKMDWREINFAYQSATQQPLLDILLQYYENKLQWHIVRDLGITLWLHNIKAAQSEGVNMASVEQVLDAVGQSAYRSTQPPDPADASLFLLANRKKAVLLSLWRVAVGHREQKGTQNFLRRDFEVEDNKIAARKNAYALMGKRRFQYAAAFFLLADDPTSAVSILAGQCEDLHLAVSVARAYCGDGSRVLQGLVQERILPVAQRATDRWLFAWLYAITDQPTERLHSLIAGSSHFASNTDECPIRTWQQDDPLTLTFYRELRDTVSSKSTLSTVVHPDEYRAVIRVARVLRRMGFWFIALHLVKHWSFSLPGNNHKALDAASALDVASASAVPSSSNQVGDTHLPAPVPGIPSMLDPFNNETRAGSNAATAQASEADERAAKAAALLAKMRSKNDAKPNDTPQANGVTQIQDDAKKSTQFEEPPTNSILDSFGF